MKILLNLSIATLLIGSIRGLLDTSGEILSRQKRYLIWKEGINWVQMIAGIGLPIELRDQSITVGTVVKAYYLLPNNSTYYTHPSIDYARKKRSSSRWVAYKLIESFFERNGYGDGKACLLRSICEVSAKPFERKTGILAEIIHAILTPSTTRETLDNHLNCEYHAAEKLGKEVDNCEALFPECPLNFIQQFTKMLS
ncbi:uncharacterized protein LOC107399276 [Tribolium castaneum]|uniref:uncharacterized protein LOC107399276 n=1 Tax=Tribolium castaneum TaxID=7070 RepID=UPI00077DCE11|nr:PREDICTED: uncharacterized protein LOC662534 [Tribolium castaneum]|eukprot:XP_973717.2 PREDICTED: uncharacterized protein LOC662534 [Tribolium castaneum]